MECVSKQCKFIIDVLNENKIIKCDNDFFDLTGYNSFDLCNGLIRLNEIMHPSDDLLSKHICINDSNEFSFVFCLETKNGVFIPVTALIKTIKSKEIFNVEVTITPLSDNVYSLDKLGYTNLNFKKLLENVPCGVAVYETKDRGLKLVYATDKFYSMLGYTYETYNIATNGGYVGNLIYSADKERVIKKVNEAIENERSVDMELRMIKADGSIAYIILNGCVFSNKDGNIRVQTAYTDITESKKRDEIIKLQAERYKIIEENTNEMLFDYNLNLDVLNLPKAFVSFHKTSYIEGYIKNDYARKTIHPEDYWRFITVWRSASVSAQKNFIDIRSRIFDNEMIWYRIHFVSVQDINGRISHIYGRFENIDKEKKLSIDSLSNEKIIERLSMTDSVTGLYNRHAFKDIATSIIAEYDGTYCMALAYSDINNFSYFNDNFGYDAGDNMLFDFSAVIKNSKETKVGCRLNSDFFTVILIGENEDALLKSIRERDMAFINLQQKKYPRSEIHVSTGVYFIKNNEEDFTIALDNANLARRKVKGDKKAYYGLYTEELRLTRTREQMISSKLQSAIDDGYIEMFLQPKFSINSRKVIGAEALARWRNPDGTYKYPCQFIDVLEKIGYIIELDFFMYESALKYLFKWKKMGYEPVPISVNFSRMNNRHSDFTERIVELAEKYNIEKKYIELEITESAFQDDTKAMLNNMEYLRAKGFKVDIDDFGTGYSSLSFLLNAPIDVVKVDKVFVDGINSSDEHREYVRQMCLLINTTKKEIIFEGVENEQQAEFLQSCGFDIAQGWLFDKAISADNFEKKYIFNIC